MSETPAALVLQRLSQSPESLIDSFARPPRADLFVLEAAAIAAIAADVRGGKKTAAGRLIILCEQKLGEAPCRLIQRRRFGRSLLASERVYGQPCTNRASI